MHKVDKFKKFIPFKKISENIEEICNDTDDCETVIIPADSTNPDFENNITDVTNDGSYSTTQNTVDSLTDKVLTFAQFIEQEMNGGDFEAEIVITQGNPAECCDTPLGGPDSEYPVVIGDNDQEQVSDVLGDTVLEEGEDESDNTEIRQTISEMEEDENYEGDSDSDFQNEDEETSSPDVKQSGKDEFNKPIQGSEYGNEYEEYIEGEEFEEDESDDEKDGVFTFSDWQKRKRTNESRSFKNVDDFINFYDKKYTKKK